jgi:Tetratricopeptide repeat
MSLKDWLVAFAASLFLTLPALAQDRLDGAEALLQAGQVTQANQLASAYLAEHPDDAGALILLGRTQIAAERPDLARETARRAWRAARGRPDLRFVAARLAARSAADQRRFGAAQFWLRLAADVAQDVPSRAIVAQSMAELRKLDPKTTRVSFSLTPSTNINGGSSADRLIVDGITTPLLFSADARALSGLEAHLDVDHRWRIANSAAGSTFLGLRVSGSTFVLSGASKAQAPDLAGSDLSSAIAEMTLRRVKVLAGGEFRYGAALARTWYGGDAQSVKLRFDVSAARRLSPSLSGDVFALIEARHADRSNAQSTAVLVSGGLDWSLATSTIGANLTLTQVNAPDRPADAYKGAELAIVYAPLLQNFAVKPTVSLTASVNRFDTVLGNVFGDGGRTDNRLGLDVRFDLVKAERYGFRPNVTVSGARTWSNVSRYDGQELAVSFGLSSSF